MSQHAADLRAKLVERKRLMMEAKAAEQRQEPPQDPPHRTDAVTVRVAFPKEDSSEEEDEMGGMPVPAVPARRKRLDSYKKEDKSDSSSKQHRQSGSGGSTGSSDSAPSMTASVSALLRTTTQVTMHSATEDSMAAEIERLAQMERKQHQCSWLTSKRVIGPICMLFGVAMIFWQPHIICWSLYGGYNSWIPPTESALIEACPGGTSGLARLTLSTMMAAEPAWEAPVPMVEPEVEPESAEPETAEPETAEPESAEPESAEPESAVEVEPEEAGTGRRRQQHEGGDSASLSSEETQLLLSALRILVDEHNAAQAEPHGGAEPTVIVVEPEFLEQRMDVNDAISNFLGANAHAMLTLYSRHRADVTVRAATLTLTLRCAAACVWWWYRCGVVRCCRPGVRVDLFAAVRRRAVAAARDPRLCHQV
jgi:hypothetical protein